MNDNKKKYFNNLEGYETNVSQSIDIKVDSIVESVKDKFDRRSEVGIKKYGTTLYDSPDGFYSFLNHLSEELMDALLYIEKLKNLFFVVLKFYYTFVENKDIMKVLMLFLTRPHYLLILLVVGVLFIIGAVFELLSFPFFVVVKSTELSIKKLLKLLKK
jgi:hypothetical protein